MPANREFARNNARTGGGIHKVCGYDPAQSTPLFRIAKAGNSGHLQADGKGIGCLERPVVRPHAKVVLKKSVKIMLFFLVIKKLSLYLRCD